jgi:hypothetical protein
LAPTAQITLREVAEVALEEPAAALSALFFAVAADMEVSVDATDIRDLVALLTPLSVPLFVTCVTRSPPRTGRPA